MMCPDGCFWKGLENFGAVGPHLGAPNPIQDVISFSAGISALEKVGKPPTGEQRQAVGSWP